MFEKIFYEIKARFKTPPSVETSVDFEYIIITLHILVVSVILVPTYVITTTLISFNNI